MPDKFRSNIEKIGEWCKPISSIMPDRQHFSIAFVKMLSIQELLLLVLWVAREINGFMDIGLAREICLQTFQLLTEVF